MKALTHFNSWVAKFFHQNGELPCLRLQIGCTAQTSIVPQKKLSGEMMMPIKSTPLSKRGRTELAGKCYDLLCTWEFCLNKDCGTGSLDMKRIMKMSPSA